MRLRDRRCRALICRVALLAAGFLAACAGRETRWDKRPDELYRLAQEALDDSDYERAQSLINQIRDEFPFSKFAMEGELLGADMAYKRKNYEEAAAAYRSFEELHPTHPKVPYAMYHRGLAYMELSQPEDRDQTATKNGAEALQKLLYAYPKCEYASDARTRLTEARDRLAGHELHVARYYARREKYDAALTRLRGLVQNYPESQYRDEALQMALKLEGEKKQADSN